jgi:hypothetical protein
MLKMCRIGKYIPDISDKERRASLICEERQIARTKRGGVRSSR